MLEAWKKKITNSFRLTCQLGKKGAAQNIW